MEISKLLSAAMEALDNSYSPYSGYRVGAAILCRNGAIYSGCNIENSSYPVSVCAEISALSAAISSGNRGLEKIAVISSGEDICMPCGQCRQALNEFNPDMSVICANSKGEYKEYLLSELLPHSFQNFASHQKPE